MAGTLVREKLLRADDAAANILLAEAASIRLHHKRDGNSTVTHRASKPEIGEDDEQSTV